MTKTIVYLGLYTGLAVALIGSAGSVLAKDKREDKGKRENAKPVRVESPKVRPAEQPTTRKVEPPKVTRQVEQPRRSEQPKTSTPRLEPRATPRTEQPRNSSQIQREAPPKNVQLPKPDPKVTLPKPDPRRDNNLPRGSLGTESNIQDRLRDRLKDAPKPGDKAIPGINLPGAERRPSPRDNPPQRGTTKAEDDIQQRLRDRLKESPKGNNGPKDAGPNRKVEPRDPPPRGKVEQLPGNIKLPERKPVLPGNDNAKRVPSGTNPPKLPGIDQAGRGDRTRPDGKPAIDLGKMKDRVDNNLVDKRPNRLPIRIDKDGDVARIAGRADLQEQFKHLQHARDPEDFRKHWDQIRNRDDLRHDPVFKNVDLKRVSGGFQSRLADHDWDNLRKARFASKYDLDRQFNLYRRGDVARQLNLTVNLTNRGGWQHRYYGPIAPAYRANHFSIWYSGASWYPRAVWCPRWSPWVAWSWWNRPIVFFDPRPIYCRPAYWNPCPTWVYYQTPVWQPLPIVACGTWVDVPVVPIQPQALDLQVLAVRFVDPGHPEQTIGPRFRMWLRNNSPVDIATPFNVMLLASPDTHIDASLPQSGATIDRIAAGETLAVDIRLPFEANRVAMDDQGRAVPFNFLHAIVDSHRQLDEVDEANNGAMLARGDILPVDPAAFSTDVTAAAPGAVVTLAGEGLGPEPGQVIVTFSGLEQDAEIHGWYDLGIQFRLPNLPLASAVDAEVVVVRGDGAVSNPVAIQIAPPSMLTEVPPAAVPPAPVQ